MFTELELINRSGKSKKVFANFCDVIAIYYNPTSEKEETVIEYTHNRITVSGKPTEVFKKIFGKYINMGANFVKEYCVLTHSGEPAYVDSCRVDGFEETDSCVLLLFSNGNLFFVNDNVDEVAKKLNGVSDFSYLKN